MLVEADASRIYLRAFVIYALSVSFILIAVNPISTQNQPHNDDELMHPKKLKEHRFAQVKNRTIKTLSPSYDIISLNEPESILSLLTKDSPNRTSVMDNGFQENLAKLKKLARAKQQSVRRQQQVAAGSNQRHPNSTLEDDIETVNALIGMLMMANRKLIEQRNKLKDVTQTGNHTTSVQILDKRKGRKELKSAAKIEQRAASASAPTISDSKESNTGKTRPKTSKKATKIPKPIVTDAIYQSQNLSKIVPLKNETRSQELQADAQDYMLVRPGFDHRDDGEPEKVPFESQDQRYQLPRRDEQLPTGLIGLNHLDERQRNEEDMMRAHKPVVAKDLLHIAPQPQSRSPTYPYDGSLKPENLFFTKPSPDGRNQVYEYMQQAPHSHDREDAHLREHPVSDERYRDQNDLVVLQRHEPVVPPYNSLGWARHPSSPLNMGHPLAQRVGDINELGHVIGAPQLPPNEHPLLQNKHLAHYRPTPPIEGGDHPGQQVGDNAIINQPFISPIHQLLMAAKNQQAAALAYDRRRLEHEMNLQRQQDEMKRQHAANVERQRQQAEMELAKAKEKGQVESEQEEQPDNGAAEPQLRQRPQQEQQQQDGGAQGDNGAEQEAEKGHENDGNAVDQQQPAQDEAGRKDDKKDSERDFQNFQNFAGDTDFTDLFPPGILSEAEIKEMRQQQEEQRRRQEQEEREKQEQAGEGDQQEGEGGGGGDDQSSQPVEQANQAGADQEEPSSSPKMNELMTGKSDGLNQTVVGDLVQRGSLEGSARQLSSNASSTALNNQAAGPNNTTQQQPTRSTRGLVSHRPIGGKHEASLKAADSYYRDGLMEPSLTGATQFDDDDDRGRYDSFVGSNNVARPLQYAYDEPASGAYRPLASMGRDR